MRNMIDMFSPFEATFEYYSPWYVKAFIVAFTFVQFFTMVFLYTLAVALAFKVVF